MTDRFEDIVNLKKSDKILIVGEVPSVYDSSKHSMIKDIGDFNLMIKNRGDFNFDGSFFFDRIIVSDKIIINSDHLNLLSKINAGLIVILDGGYHSSFDDLIEELEAVHWPADFWVFKTDLGNCIVTNAKSN